MNDTPEPTESDAGAELPAELADHVLTFPEGIPGFPHLRHFVLLEIVDDGAFQELRSIEDPDVSMFVTIPWLFFPDYTPVVSDAEQQVLGLTSSDDALVFCPVTVDPQTEEIYVNLLGPFVVNIHTRKGRQLVLAGTDYPVRAPVSLPAA